jgi:hypothetical protein
VLHEVENGIQHQEEEEALGIEPVLDKTGYRAVLGKVSQGYMIITYICVIMTIYGNNYYIRVYNAVFLARFSMTTGGAGMPTPARLYYHPNFTSYGRCRRPI